MTGIDSKRKYVVCSLCARSDCLRSLFCSNLNRLSLLFVLPFDLPLLLRTQELQQALKNSIKTAEQESLRPTPRDDAALLQGVWAAQTAAGERGTARTRRRSSFCKILLCCACSSWFAPAGGHGAAKAHSASSDSRA